MERFPEKPIGDDGKPMSDAAWIKLHQIMARMIMKYGEQIAMEKEAKGA